MYQIHPSEEFTQTRAAFILDTLKWLMLDVCLRLYGLKLLQEDRETDRVVLLCCYNECSIEGTT